MRRLFSRKSADTVDVKERSGKDGAKEVKAKKSFFGRSLEKSDKRTLKPSAVTSTQSSNASSASSTFSVISPVAPTPSGSSSSVSSVMSYTEGIAGTPGSVSTAPSTVPSPAPSTFSRSPGSHTSLSSANSAVHNEKPNSLKPVPLVRPSISPISRPNSRPTSSAEPRKVPSPLSAVMDSTSMLTPPPSSRGGVDGEMNPKRRNSIYNIFRKSLSQPDLHSAPSSRSNSTTTLPTTCTAPFMPPIELVPPATPPLNKRASVILRRATGMTQSLEDVISSSDGVLSRNEATAHRAILMGDPLGGGTSYFRYPTAQGTQKAPKPPRQPISPPPGQAGHRNSRRGHGRPNDQSRRNSWAPGPGHPANGGMVWREPQFGGKFGGRMTIDEENEMMEQYAASRAGSRAASRAGSRAGSQVGSPREYLEDVPYFQQPIGPQIRQRPMSMAPGSPSGGWASPVQTMQRQKSQQPNQRQTSPAPEQQKIVEQKIADFMVPSSAPDAPIGSLEPLPVSTVQPQLVQV